MSNFKLKDKHLEYTFLIFLFSMLIWTGVGTLWDKQLSHDYPYAHLASDAFQHQVRVESIKQMGNYRYEAPYIAGGFTDAIGFYPPVMYHLAVIFSHTSGLESYDALYFMIFFVMAVASLVMYLIIKKFNQNVAIISSALFFLLFATKAAGPGPYSGFTWGVWPAYIGNFFLIAIFWVMTNFELKKSYVLLAILISGSIHAHTAEFLISIMFIILFIGIKFLYKKFDWKDLKKLSIAAIITLVVSFYYLIIFKFVYVDTQISDLSITKTTGDPTIYLPDFGIILVVLVIGLLFASLLMFKKFRMPLIIGFFMLIIGLGNHYGLDRHAYRIRTIWPIYLSIFLGLGIYQVLKFAIKKWRTTYSYGVFAIFLLIFISIIPIPNSMAFHKFTTPGIMNPFNTENSFHWDMFLWSRDNIPEESKVLFLYGDVYGQNAILRNTFKPPYMVTTGDYINLVKENKFERNIKISLLGDHHGVYYAYRKSLFEYGFHAKELGKEYFYNKVRDVCEFDYYIVDKFTRQQAIAQYNIALVNLMASSGWFEQVYSNDVISIFKNNQPGDDCFAQSN